MIAPRFLIAAAALLSLCGPTAGWSQQGADQIESRQGGNGAPPRSPGSDVTGSTSTAPLRDNAGIDQPSISLLQNQRAGRRAPPFGSELFRTVPSREGGTSLDPGYVIHSGDTIQISQTGMVNSNVQATVDPAGNVVVPGVGPVHVDNVPAGEINNVIASAARSVYRDGVQTYAAPISASRISVFVTGPVVNPGVYSGSSADSIVGFLQRAGGPDAGRGSYRHIYVRRQGQIVATLDLYAFLSTGALPPIHLQQGDVIVVAEQGPVITVSGQARAPFTFELESREGFGEEVLRYARARPEVTDVSVLSIRDTRPVNEVVPIAGFASIALHDGDWVRFEANAHAETYVVLVEGAVDNQASVVVPRGTRLGVVLRQLNLDPLADRSMIHLKRVSVAESQRRLLNESLDRLERAIYTTPSATPEIAAQRQVDATGLRMFVERARMVQPEGIVSLQGTNPDDIVLEPDDIVVVPFLSQNVVVGGEVSLPQSLIADGPHPVAYYIQRAGGFTERANRSQTLVLRPDGAAHLGGLVHPGDRVLVPPKLSSGTFSMIRDVTTILYQIGIAAAALVAL